ncbi:MAG: metalloregulator ArsR/SmtB family transcription factor [Pseudomonadota bacterium]
MAYDAILTALADPTRRAILDRLRDGGKPVARIAEPLPVSRPAVSQHLKVMLEAGLVTMDRQGTRNIYALAPGGAADLVAWLGDLSERPCATPGSAHGLRRRLDLRLTAAEAWQMFCEDLPLWWPVSQVSLSAEEGALPQGVVFEPVEGGELREIRHDGQHGLWGTVTRAIPGEWLEMNWTLGTDGPTRLTVAFTAVPDGCRLDLTHAAPPDGDLAAMWDLVLMDRFAAAARASLSNF